MYGYPDLKPHLPLTEDTVPCPVRDCPQTVRRQRKSFKTLPDFLCPDHEIYISPSTFEYQDFRQNLLWADPDDIALLDRIFTVKSESRMARNNSEDALSWNVFRFLEKSTLLDSYLANLSGGPVTGSHILYWSYSKAEDVHYSLLADASREFGEQGPHRSEPDLIVLADSGLFFIEAKFTSGNKTTPYNSSVGAGYTSGGGNWYGSVFKANFDTVANGQRKYELLRFWLLGTWMADQLGVDFHLVNLVLETKEKAIEAAFNPLIRQDDHRRFTRQTWESIYHWLLSKNIPSKDAQKLMAYFKTHTRGYNHKQQLQRAFNL